MLERNINLSAVDDIVAVIGRSRDKVIPILKSVQNRFNYLPEPALRRICEISEITPTGIAGVSTFYSQFRHQPAGIHTIRICIGTACHVKGAETVLSAFKKALDIPEHEDTDAEKLFTIERAACLGCCMLAPVVQIDQVIYGFLNAEKAPHVLKDFLESRADFKAQDQSLTKKGENFNEIKMCLCSSCKAAGAGIVYDEFCRQVSEAGLHATVRTVGCTGISYEAPLVEVVSSGRHYFYGSVETGHVRTILFNHFRAPGFHLRVRQTINKLLDRILTDEDSKPSIYRTENADQSTESLSWEKQRHIATEHAGSLDPLDIDEYIAHGGFEGFKRCFRSLSPENIINELKKSHLRGRGGAGFHTADKWAKVRNTQDDTKYIICNGDEGDPGAFMDRLLLESFPFRVIEGMMIAAFALKASKGILYIRSEYSLAINRIKKAVKLCESRGFTDINNLSTGLSFQLEVAQGAGAFVCGEETALIAALEGRRGTPHYRPPYPYQHGLWGKPTLVNNVETFALIPWIFRNGAEAFARMGSESSRGTKTFALAGKIVRGGLIEVPMGITLREIIEDIGGGIQGHRKLKAVQIGGPSGGCMPASLIDTRVDYDAIVSAGAIMGSGGLVVLDETDCMVDIARYFMTFTQSESCGKCTYCRVGTKQMLEILERLCGGKGRQGDIEKLEHLSRIVKTGSLCGLGRTAPNPVLSTLKYFRSEYEAHIKGICPSGKCRALITYSITEDCIGCTRCAQRCPSEAIEMTPHEQHHIDTDICIRCGTCVQACPVDAVRVT